MEELAIEKIKKKYKERIRRESEKNIKLYNSIIDNILKQIEDSKIKAYEYEGEMDDELKMLFEKNGFIVNIFSERAPGLGVSYINKIIISGWAE